MGAGWSAPARYTQLDEGAERSETMDCAYPGIVSIPCVAIGNYPVLHQILDTKVFRNTESRAWIIKMPHTE